MPLENPKINKTWFENNDAEEEMWDEIAEELVSYGVRSNNNLKQLGLDLAGDDYSYNNQGKTTQTIPVITRLNALENAPSFGFANLGLDVSNTSVIELCAADATDLSSTNKGYMFMNSSVSGGQLKRLEFEANQSVLLTGAHWGFDTLGDLSDKELWIVVVHTTSDTGVLGVALRGGRESIADTDTVTNPANATTNEKVIVSTALSAGTYNVSYLGWFKANFDDTGNVGGENHWTIQTGDGDINLGGFQSRFEGTVVF